MKSTFTYRRAVLKDVPLLVEKDIQRMRETEAWGEEMLAFFHNKASERFLRRMEKGAFVIFLAFDGNTFAGMGGLEDFHDDEWSEFFEDGEPDNDACVSCFYTEPCCRHQGVMHQIFRMVLQEAKARKLKRMRISVDYAEYQSRRQIKHYDSTRNQAKALGFEDVYGFDEEGNYGLTDVMDWVFERNC